MQLPIHTIYWCMNWSTKWCGRGVRSHRISTHFWSAYWSFALSSLRLINNWFQTYGYHWHVTAAAAAAAYFWVKCKRKYAFNTFSYNKPKILTNSYQQKLQHIHHGLWCGMSVCILDVHVVKKTRFSCDALSHCDDRICTCVCIAKMYVFVSAIWQSANATMPSARQYMLTTFSIWSHFPFLRSAFAKSS